MTELRSPIPALLPANGEGHQFVVYADCCSGVPGTTNERTFAAVTLRTFGYDPSTV
ncbi:MAG: hypothetical protein R2839_03560 [Thermomicrobiales bacterium]